MYNKEDEREEDLKRGKNPSQKREETREKSRDSPFCNIPQPQKILQMSILDLGEGFGEDISDLLYYRTIM